MSGSESSSQPLGATDSAATARRVQQAITSGSWSEIRSGVGSPLSSMATTADPVGMALRTVASELVAVLLEYVRPLSEVMEWLVGDQHEINAYARTYRDLGATLRAVAADLTTEVDKIVHWGGHAARAHASAARTHIHQLKAASTAAETISVLVEAVGEVVAAALEEVRHLVAECVAALLVRVTQWTVLSGGMAVIASPLAAASIAMVIAKWVRRIAEVMNKLMSSLEKLLPHARELGGLLESIKETLLGRAKSAHTPAATTASNTRLDSSISPRPHGPDHAVNHSGDGELTPIGSTGGPARKAPYSPPLNQHKNPKTRPPEKSRCVLDPIDVSSGDMVLEQVDVELPAELPLLFKRVHISSSRVGRSFGPSWSSTVDQRLEIDSDCVCFAAEDGTLLRYSSPAQGIATSPDSGPPRTLTVSEDGSYSINDSERERTLHFGSRSGPEQSMLSLIAITDRDGNRIDIVRDAATCPVEIRHSGGYRIKVESDRGRITALYLCTADEGDVPVMRYRYANGQLTEVINESGLPLRFDYDAQGRITGWTDRNGGWYRYTFDRDGRCVRTEGSGGFLNATLEYDPHESVTYVTDSRGHRSEFHLNEAGQVVREVDPLGNATASTWDDQDNLLSRTDPLGRTTRYDYDPAGNLTALTRPDHSQTLFGYDDLHQLVTITAPDGTTSQREYDEHGKLARTIDPTGAATTYRYRNGHLTEVRDALGHTRRVTTNAAGLPIAVTDARGAETRYDRDAWGRVTAITDPLGGRTRFGWTIDGHLAWRSQPDGAIEYWTYDGEGNVIAHTDALGHTTRTEVTHFDLPSAETRPDGARREFSYDTELRLVSVTNEQGLVWNYEYDAAGRLVRETDFNGRVLAYRHDKAGQLVERINALGQSTHFAYDPLGNILRRRTEDDISTFGYDQVGRLTQATNGDADVRWHRDPMGRVCSETINERTIVSRYDRLGHRTSKRTPSGAVSEWAYDPNGNPSTLRTSGRTLRFSHDVLGRETHRSLSADAKLSQSWDSNDRLVSRTVHGSGKPNHPTQHRSYSYRPDGMPSHIHDQLAGSRAIDLDLAGQVTTVRQPHGSEAYAYDAAGNVAHAEWPAETSVAEICGSRSYAGTLLRRAGDVRYEHDAQNRMVLRQHKRLSRKPDTWRYFWDSQDRLTGVLTPDGTQWLYRYDALGRRIAKQRLSSDRSRVVEQIDFTWDGLVLTEQAHTGPTSDDPQVTTWDYEPGTFRPVTQIVRAPLRNASRHWIDEQFHAIVTDLAGCPTELVTDHGEVDWRHQTTLWGNTLSEHTSGVSTPLRFLGQYKDWETGLHYNHHRYYDPATARYISADPLGLDGGTNPHHYVSNPHNWADPLGLSPCEVHSKHDNDERLVKEAQKTGRTHQRDIDRLTAQLADGNRNPGIGTKRVFGNVFEARSRNGARVYFQEAGKVIEILGKSSKANQPRVISILEELYANR